VPALAQTFQQHGLPHSIRLDRDPRWVGAPQGSDFPSAVLRFCRSLGISVLVCDPRHPQQNGWVERYHRSYGEACLDRYRPRTVEEVRQVTETFVEHYNWQRPHQGLACGNRPPRVAHPELPALPRVPDVVNADGWVQQLDGQHLVRRVNRHGSVTINLAHYYLSRSLAGQAVTLRIDGVNGLLLVQHPQLLRKSFPRKRLAASGLALSALSGLDAAGGIARTPSACSTAASGLSTGSGLPLMLRCQEAVVLTMLVPHTGSDLKL
jgi:integrase-like protein